MEVLDTEREGNESKWEEDLWEKNIIIILRFRRIEFEIVRRKPEEIWSRSDCKICISEGEAKGLKMRMSSA